MADGGRWWAAVAARAAGTEEAGRAAGETGRAGAAVTGAAEPAVGKNGEEKGDGDVISEHLSAP